MEAVTVHIDDTIAYEGDAKAHTEDVNPHIEPVTAHTETVTSRMDSVTSHLEANLTLNRKALLNPISILPRPPMKKWRSHFKILIIHFRYLEGTIRRTNIFFCL